MGIGEFTTVKYKELLKNLQQLTPEQLEQTVYLVCTTNVDWYPDEEDANAAPILKRVTKSFYATMLAYAVEYNLPGTISSGIGIFGHTNKGEV
jgi:hypothetical protein